MLRALLSFLSSLSITFVAFAQQGRITGPVSAWFYDEPTQSVRSMIGVPGASYFGAVLAGNLERAAVAPNGRAAAGLRDGSVVLMNLADSSESLIARGSVEFFVWNDSSTAAAWIADGRIVVFRAEDQSLVDLGEAPGAPSALALDAEARNVYAAGESGIYRLRSGEPASLAASIPKVTSLALSRDGASLFAVDRAARQVLEIGALDGGASLFSRDAADPSAVALTPDGKGVLITDSESRRILLIRRDTGNLAASVDLSFTPTRLKPIGAGIYVLNHRGKQDPLEILHIDSALASYFVPAPQEE
jgi:hypothetical protein